MSKEKIQMTLDLGIATSKNVNGVEMGVLENGIAYLTQRGLAELCGQSHKKINDITKEWEEHFEDDVISKNRISTIRDYLFSRGFKEPSLYLACKNGDKVFYAYPEIVCMAILEYYAFDAKTSENKALENYRTLARAGLQAYIYATLGYDPQTKWKYYTDRISLLKSKVPIGYFSIFSEASSMIVDLIDSGLTVNDKTIPDISIGITWSNYWKSNSLAEQYGEATSYDHEYPDYYSQSLSNPQQVKAYPDNALGVFRKWFREIYLTTKFPTYILKKANLLPGGRDEAERMVTTFASSKALEDTKP